MQNKILIIAGMHRSGTSLVSHWLNACGLNVGEKLLGSHIGNVEGHFEDVDFYRFHEDTLEDHNESRFGWVTHPITGLTVYETEKLNSIIALKNKMNAQWGWKDPRTCLFLDHYREILPDAYYLNIFRDYRSTVSSMISRDFKYHEIRYLSRKFLSRAIWKNFRRKKRLKKFYKDLSEFYLNVWITYNEQILQNAGKLDETKYITVDCRRLCDTSEQILNHLKNVWGFDLKPYDFKKIFKESLLNPAADIDQFITDRSVLEKAGQVEKLLKELCEKNTNSLIELL